MSEEVWKPVVGYEGKYEVSNLGRVRSLKRINADGRTVNARIRKQFKGARYRTLLLYRGDGTRQTKLVHRLVARAFLGPCPESHQVNHKNGKKHDNRAENLEYVTQSQNTQHAYDELGAIGPRGETQGQSKLTTTDVIEIKRLLAFTDLTQREIGVRFGITRGAVGRIFRGPNWLWLHDEYPHLDAWAKLAVKRRDRSSRTITCPVCKRRVLRKPSAIARGAKYCSQSCAAHDRQRERDDDGRYI